MDLRGTQKAASILVSIFGMKLVIGPSLISFSLLCFIQRYLHGNNGLSLRLAVKKEVKILTAPVFEEDGGIPECGDGIECHIRSASVSYDSREQS